jgi:hypothetical protein
MQARALACPRDAGRSGLGCGQGARPACALSSCGRRGHQIAAVAVARKLAVLCWHLLTKAADYQWARPALVANKLRSMELQAGRPARKGSKRGPAYYNIKELRDREIELVRHAEQAYERFVSQWQRHGIIGHAVWLYFRFSLGLRMVEELLAACGITVTHETVRQWARKFGQHFANQPSPPSPGRRQMASRIRSCSKLLG